MSVIISAVAAYTGNNNDRNQQTYGLDRSGPEKILEMTRNGHNFFFPNVKMINAAVKTHAAVPEKLTINFFWPYKCFFLILFYMFFVLIFQVSAGC